jgi:hypothetical protein
MHLDDVLTELVEHSGDRLLRVAYQLTHDAAAAEDLVQEALLRVYQSVRHRGLAPEDWYAAVAAVVVGCVWAGGLLGGHKQAPVSGTAVPVQRVLSCPASYAHQAPWVPANRAARISRSPARP